MKAARCTALLFSLFLTGAYLVFAPVASAVDKASPAGLSKAEATAIANRFFAEKIGIEAVVGEPTLQGDNWAFPLKVGYAARTHRDPILVNRVTGEASWAGLAALNAIRSGSNPAPSK